MSEFVDSTDQPALTLPPIEDSPTARLLGIRLAAMGPAQVLMIDVDPESGSLTVRFARAR